MNEKMINIMVSITRGAKVTFYRYRTALVGDPVFEIDREMDLAQCLEYMLAASAGAREDNHTVYEVHIPREDPVYIFFSDNKVRVGKTLVLGAW